MPGNNGTAVGSPSFASTAQSFSNTNGAANFGNCVALNGSTQRIDLPVSTLQFALNASWTIRGRFRTTTSSGIQVIASYGQTSGTPSDDIWIGVSSGVLQASVKNIGVLGTISVADGNWHTFEYSYTGGTKTGILFVDGVVSGANAAATAYPGSAGNANALSCIGAFAGGSAPAFYWNGQVGAAGARTLRGVKRVQTADFRAACAVLAHARAYIGPEGGLHHAAAALGVPAIVIFGGYISPEQTGYGEHVNLFTGRRPCGMRIACAHCVKAMAEITPDAVLEALATVLRREETHA